MERLGRCRHVGICSYFGEKIDDKDLEIKAAYCQSMCDVSAGLMLDKCWSLQGRDIDL